jgi:hypothetical protein
MPEVNRKQSIHIENGRLPAADLKPAPRYAFPFVKDKN